MAHFLRDQLLTNLTINEERLTQINGVFEAQSLTLPERANPQPSQPQRLLLSYIIRFDNKGYRTYLFPQLLNYFRQANYVERILFTLELIAGLFGWVWIVASIGALVCLVLAIGFDGRWSRFFWAVAISVVSKWLAKAFQDTQTRVHFEAKKIPEGMSPADARREWYQHYTGHK